MNFSLLSSFSFILVLTFFSLTSIAEVGVPKGSRFTNCTELFKTDISRLHVCLDTQNNKFVVIKAISKNNSKFFINEAFILMKLKGYLSVIQLYGIMFDENFLYEILEYAEGGDFFGLITRHYDNGMPEDLFRPYFYQMVSALSYLHLEKIAHLDIKPENLFLQQKGKKFILKLGDFGLSERVKKPYLLTSARGSLSWIAPEVMMANKNNPFDPFKADVFSTGLVFFTALTGYFLFDSISVEDPQYEIFRKYGLKKLIKELRFEKYFSHEAIKLLEKMLEIDPKKRISMLQVLTDPWLVKTCGPTRP